MTTDVVQSHATLKEAAVKCEGESTELSDAIETISLHQQAA